MTSANSQNSGISRVELDRRTFRKKQSAKSVFVSMASLIVFSTIIYFVVTRSQGWSIVKQMYFDPEIFVRSIPKIFGGFHKGLILNVEILFFAVIGVGILATLLALARTIKNPILFPLKVFSTVYTDLFRGVPLLIILYLVGFGVPALGIFGRINPAILGTIAITICYSAYVAEVIRAGIEAIHPSQRDAARSLGLTHSRTMRTIILPQAIRKVTPALMNDFVAMQKDVGLVSVLGAVDAIRMAGIENAMDFNYTHYIVAGLMFIALSFPFIRLTNWYTKRAREREEKGGTV